MFSLFHQTICLSPQRYPFFQPQFYPGPTASNSRFLSVSCSPSSDCLRHSFFAFLAFCSSFKDTFHSSSSFHFSLNLHLLCCIASLLLRSSISASHLCCIKLTSVSQSLVSQSQDYTETCGFGPATIISAYNDSS